MVPHVTVYVRHSATCPNKGDEFYRKCKCRKHLRWHYKNRLYRKAAQTRTWVRAEEAARRVEAQYDINSTVVKDTRKSIDEAAELFINRKKSKPGEALGSE